MYLRQSKQTRADGSTLSHLQIAESVWDPLKKRSRVRIVYNCGRSDDPEVTERLRRLARSILKRCSPEAIVAQGPSWRVLDAWPYGDVHVLEHLWRRVGLPELIGELVGVRKLKFPVEPCEGTESGAGATWCATTPRRRTASVSIAPRCSKSSKGSWPACVNPTTRPTASVRRAARLRWLRHADACLCSRWIVRPTSGARPWAPGSGRRTPGRCRSRAPSLH